jgi:hypothetical protein
VPARVLSPASISARRWVTAARLRWSARESRSAVSSQLAAPSPEAVASPAAGPETDRAPRRVGPRVGPVRVRVVRAQARVVRAQAPVDPALARAAPQRVPARAADLAPVEAVPPAADCAVDRCRHSSPRSAQRRSVLPGPRTSRDRSSWAYPVLRQLLPGPSRPRIQQRFMGPFHVGGPCPVTARRRTSGRQAGQSAQLKSAQPPRALPLASSEPVSQTTAT